MKKWIESEHIDHIVNIAAESHVDRSIRESAPFLQTNIIGTQILLECARTKGVRKFLQVSTDEVYGSLGKEGEFTETSPLCPSNPYAASKASSDLICQSYFQTHKVPILITRTVNNFGPHQHPEKLIPVLINCAKNNQKLPLYGSGTNVRSWIFIQDHCEALWQVLTQGNIGEVYNISSGIELSNLEVAQKILSALQKPENFIEFIEDRPGHDFRYALNCQKLQRETGWKSKTSFDQGLQLTVDWVLSSKGPYST